MNFENKNNQLKIPSQKIWAGKLWLTFCSLLGLVAELIEASENLSPHRTDPIFFENSAKENSPTWVVVLAHVVKDNT